MTESERKREGSKKQERDLKIQLNCCCAASNVPGEKGEGVIKNVLHVSLAMLTTSKCN